MDMNSPGARVEEQGHHGHEVLRHTWSMWSFGTLATLVFWYMNNPHFVNLLELYRYGHPFSCRGVATMSKWHSTRRVTDHNISFWTDCGAGNSRTSVDSECIHQTDGARIVVTYEENLIILLAWAKWLYEQQVLRAGDKRNHFDSADRNLSRIPPPPVRSLLFLPSLLWL